MNKSYNLQLTDDGSSTLHSSEFNQNMHTTSGAWEEALIKHVIASGILDKREPVAFDIGLGLGYNTLALLIEAKKNDCGFISVEAFEYDRSILSFAREIEFIDERDWIYRSILKAMEKGHVEESDFALTVHYGDARTELLRIREPADAVFHDPYSPYSNPELWSVDFFIELRRRMKKDALLTTYSSSPKIRRALLEAGFNVGRGASTGPKREGTLASTGDIRDPLAHAEINELFESKKAIPYRDSDFSSTREQIINQREKERSGR